MIKAAETTWGRKAFHWLESKILFPLWFAAVKVNPVSIPEENSVLLLQNHTSWWDGFWGGYLAHKYLQRKFYVMVQEDQLQKRTVFRHKGAFSVKKNSRGMLESISYTLEKLRNPANAILIFPEGKLQSLYADHIHFEGGISRILQQAPPNCQVIFNFVTINYLEGFRPTVTMHLLNCGEARTLDLTQLKEKVNTFVRRVKVETVR